MYTYHNLFAKYLKNHPNRLQSSSAISMALRWFWSVTVEVLMLHMRMDIVRLVEVGSVVVNFLLFAMGLIHLTHGDPKVLEWFLKHQQYVYNMVMLKRRGREGTHRKQ